MTEELNDFIKTELGDTFSNSMPFLRSLKETRPEIDSPYFPEDGYWKHLVYEKLADYLYESFLSGNGDPLSTRHIWVHGGWGRPITYTSGRCTRKVPA